MTITINGSGTVTGANTLTNTNTVTSAAATALTLQSAGTTAVTIDTSQNVGIGTSSPASYFSSADNLVVGTTSGNNGLTILGGSTATAVLAFGYSTGTAAGDGSNRAKIYYDGPSDTLRMSAGGSLMSASQFVLDASGNLLVGTTTLSTGAGGICLLKNGSGSSGQITVAKLADGVTNNAMAFFAGGSVVGTVSISNTATAYNTSSDYRLKNTITPMTGALAKVALLKPVTYKWNVDNSVGQGFIAHELAEVEPGAVTGEKDAVDAESKPQYQGIDTSFLVATLTSAIQEQQALITSLTARITVLENK